MSYTYARRKAAEEAPLPAAAEKESSLSDRHLDALLAGAERPTAADTGERLELSEAIRAKMESAFGADLSAVKLYRSQAVADAGARAVAQGNSIAFAPDQADLSTRRGQELLGHELSHVMGQARGEIRGSGYLRDASLEARADREGAMAAGGQQVYTGPVTGTLSAAAPSLAMAGPMQASREEENNRARETADSMVAGRQLREQVDASGQTPTEEQVSQLAAYQRNLSDVQFYRQNRKGRNFLRNRRSERFRRGKKVSGHLDAMRAQAGSAANDSNLSQEERAAANTRLQTLAGIDQDVSTAKPNAADFAILRDSRNEDMRDEAYRNLSEALNDQITDDKEHEYITRYIDDSDPFNSYLRNERSNQSYPSTEEDVQDITEGNRVISDVLGRNRLETDITTYRGVDDIYLRDILAKNKITEALDEYGGVNHDWIGQNMEEFSRRMQDVVFTDPGFVSTSATTRVPRIWSERKNREEGIADLKRRREAKEIPEEYYQKHMADFPDFDRGTRSPGAHIMELSVPKGTAAAAIDKAGTMYRPLSNQLEILLDRGGMYQFTGVEPGSMPGRYAMKLRRLTEEEAKKRGQAPSIGGK